MQGALKALDELGDRVLLQFTLIAAMLKQEIDASDTGTGPVARARQAQSVITVVVVGIVALVGILVFGEVSAAIPDSNVLNGTQDEIVTGFGDAMGLVPIILLVLLASVVIAVVQRMRA